MSIRWASSKNQRKIMPETSVPTPQKPLSSIPSKYIGAWLSLVERYVRDVEVASSNLVAPIDENPAIPSELQGFFVDGRRVRAG